METDPEVENPAMLFEETVPLRITSFEPKFSIPPEVFVRFPCIVNPLLASAVPFPLNFRF
jgi:hypothetical protein